ncbi:MAG: DUF1566 domain-containing protein [Syntrophobacteraceae bacterium]
MKKFLLISFALVLVCTVGNAFGADDFYVIPGQKANYAPVEKSGQTFSYATGDDGDLEKGVIWPSPRFTNNGNGTVTDNLTGLIWKRDANFAVAKTWAEALGECNNLASGSSGLSDGSQAGDWRLPNLKELLSLIDYGRSYAALPSGHPFSWDPAPYWSSTTIANDTNSSWTVEFSLGGVGSSTKSDTAAVWPVRGGK